jgi:hypothetical protein
MTFGTQALAGFGHFFAGRHQEAYACAEAALRERPNFLPAAGVAAASAALSGKSAEASAAMMRFRQIDPKLNLSNLASWLPFRRAEDQECQSALNRDPL